MPQVDYHGVEIRLGRKKYILPPLGLQGLRKNAKLIDEWGTRAAQASKSEDPSLAPLTNHDAVKHLDSMAVLITEALQRNYPDIDCERDVVPHLDARNMPHFFSIVLAKVGEGIVWTDQIAEDTEPGETKPVSAK